MVAERFLFFSLRGAKKYGMIGKLTNICSGIEVVITGLTRNQFGAIHVGSNPTRCAKNRQVSTETCRFYFFTADRRKAGTPGGTRTPDLLLRRQLLYPAELLAHVRWSG